jgi:hypothetical protein
MPPYRRLNADVEVMLGRNIKVLHCATLFADEMIVFFNHGVIAAETFTEVKFADLSLLLENMKVSIDRAQRNSRDMFPDPFMHPLRGRMGSCSFKNLKDSLPLFASFRPGCFHGMNPSQSFDNLNISNTGRNVKKAYYTVVGHWGNGVPRRTAFFWGLLLSSFFVELPACRKHSFACGGQV